MRNVIHEEADDSLEDIATEVMEMLHARKHQRVTVCLINNGHFRKARNRVFRRTEIETLDNPTPDGVTQFVLAELNKL